MQVVYLVSRALVAILCLGMIAIVVFGGLGRKNLGLAKKRENFNKTETPSLRQG